MRTATKVRNLGPRAWHRGSALYRVDPPVTWVNMGYLTYTSYVIVASTPCASDHGMPETTIFVARANGSIPKGYNLDDEIEFKECRTVGMAFTHILALSQLQGGYFIVSGNFSDKPPELSDVPVNTRPSNRLRPR